jgi:hypothetical protein
MDASLLLLGPEDKEADMFDGEETEVVKERFTSPPDDVSASSPLKYGESISKSVPYSGKNKRLPPLRNSSICRVKRRETAGTRS